MTKCSKTPEPLTADNAMSEVTTPGELPATGPTPAQEPPVPRKARENTKQAALIAMLRADKGATIPEIMQPTGWLSHTVRGALAGTLKKRGLIVTSEVVEGRGRVYHLPQA
jgi:hypothetical protein